MRLFSRISAQDKVNFAKNISVMLRGGIPLNTALALLSEQAHTRALKKVVTEVLNDIEQGTAFSRALEANVHVFGPIFVSLVRAGEKSGTLQENLLFLSDWLERNADLRSEINAATLYPKLVLGASALLGGALTVFVLPRLIVVFGEMDVELPLVTKILLAVSFFVQNYWALLAGGLVVVCVVGFYIQKITVVRRVLHTIYLKLPFIGKFLKNYQLALLTQLYATLIRSGISITESSAIVSDALTNVVYTDSLEVVKSHIEKGTTLSDVLKRYPDLYPPTFLNIVVVAEKSGTLSDSFQYLADYYEKEVTLQAKKLPTIIEPMLLVLIAAVVGFIAISIILPIYKLTGSIT